MADDLNKQYFEARKAHKENYVRKGLVIWVVIGLAIIGVLSFFIVTQLMKRWKVQNAKNEMVKGLIDRGNRSIKDTIVVSKSSGTSVLVLKNSLYVEINNSSFGVVQDDTSVLAYVSRRLVLIPGYKSSIEQWQRQILAVEPTYRFTNIRNDSISDLVFETADIEFEGRKEILMRGKIKITKKGAKYYFFQISAKTAAWSKLQDQIGRIESSFKIIE